MKKRMYEVIPILSQILKAILKVWLEIRHTNYVQMQHKAIIQESVNKTDDYLSQNEIPKLQIGSGNNIISGWLNTDIEPISPEIVYLNALEPFPFDDSLFYFIFSEHMIEHIPYLGGLHMVEESFRVLKSGGRIRIATPDIEKILALYNKKKSRDQILYILWSVVENIGLYNTEKTELQKRRVEWDIHYEHIMSKYPNPVDDSICFIVNNFFRSFGHQFLYDHKSLCGILQEAGFVNIREFAPGESLDENLRGLEKHGHLIGDENNLYETMVLEATKP
jgi:hypothetical protein